MMKLTKRAPSWTDRSHGSSFLANDRTWVGYVAFAGKMVGLNRMPFARASLAVRVCAAGARPPDQCRSFTHVTVTATSGLERAQVKWFTRPRGFGFLTRGEGAPDIFVHIDCSNGPREP